MSRSSYKMTSIIQTVENANSKLYAARDKASAEFEAAIECLWILFNSCCNVSDNLIRHISPAVKNRKNSGGKSYVAGYVQSFIRNNGEYTPHPLVTPFYEALKAANLIHETAWKAAKDEWESVVTFDALFDYHHAKNKKSMLVYDDDMY